MESVVYTQKFVEFHNNNLHFYPVFQKYARELVNGGAKRGSASSIIHRIRWEVDIQTLSEDYLINQNFAADYARMAMVDGTVPEGFFKTKQRWAKELS